MRTVDFQPGCKSTSRFDAGGRQRLCRALLFFPAFNNYFHVALLFRVVEENDPRWNAAPLFDVGRTAYISLSEMRGLFAALSAESLSWEESAKIEELETYKTIRSDGRMGIKILASGGTAKSGIPPKQMCETLAKLDAALRTPPCSLGVSIFSTAI
jgi:hypothetical protein